MDRHPSFPQIADLADTLESLAESVSDTAALTLKASKQFSGVDPAILRAAIETARGRAIAKKSFPRLSKGFFTANALHQRTHPQVAEYHGSFFAQSGHVLEVGAGLGFDTIAIAKHAQQVTTLEPDLLTATFVTENLKIAGVHNVTVRCITFEEYVKEISLSGFDGLWADPARRDEKGKRTRDPDQYTPALKELFGVEISGPIIVKVSPALDFEELPVGWKKQWIGFEGECKEQLLCRSQDSTENSVYIVEAKLLWSPEKDVDVVVEYPQEVPYTLLEPHGALSRSGALDSFYASREITRWDSDVIYGWTMAHVEPETFYSLFDVFRSESYDSKELAKIVGELGWDTRTEIKKRVFPIEPESIRKKLKLVPYKAGQTKCGVILLTTQGKKQMMLFARRRT